MDESVMNLHRQPVLSDRRVPMPNTEPFYVMPKPVGPACNMKCDYCYYLDKEAIYPNCRDFRMSDEILDLFTRQYIQSQQSPSVLFTWHGGEPLLRGIDFYTKALAFQKRYAEGKHIDNTIQTNGLLVDEEWCRFFKDNNFLVGLSIDGPQHVHDRYRRTPSGRSTFAVIYKAVNLLRKYNVEFNTLTAVHAGNASYPVEIYRFFRQIGSRYMQFIPVVECAAETRCTDRLTLACADEGGETRVTPWSVKPMDYGRFLTAIFDEWVTRDVGKYFIQFFDAVLANWCGLPPGVCVVSRTCGRGGVLEFNGDVYACDHFVFPEYRRGNIRETSLRVLMFSEKQTAFGRRKSDELTTWCRQCEYLHLCYGECLKNRIARSPQSEPGHNYLCSGLKHFYRHTEPAMRFMREELRNRRPAAGVMSRTRTKARGGP